MRRIHAAGGCWPATGRCSDALTAPVGRRGDALPDRHWATTTPGARRCPRRPRQAAYGVWLSRHGRPDEAEPLLAEARTTYASLGAVAWLEDLERESGGIPGRLVTASRPDDHQGEP